MLNQLILFQNWLKIPLSIQKINPVDPLENLDQMLKLQYQVNSQIPGQLNKSEINSLEFNSTFEIGHLKFFYRQTFYQLNETYLY
jgi:hypothetical protein